MAPKAYRQLRTILGTAVEDGLLAENPCRIRGAAKEHAEERKIPTVAQVQQIADTIEPRYRAAVLLASYCGLRKSECPGLARRHVMVDGPYAVVLVERQRIEVAGKGPVFAELKSQAAYRTVAIPAAVVEEIARHLDRYVEPDDEALLFTNPRTGDTPSGWTWQHKIWGPARGAAGLPNLRFHDLRHLAGTLTALAGGTLKEIQSRLGHASPSAAMIYQHVAHVTASSRAGSTGSSPLTTKASIGRRETRPHPVQHPCN